MTKLEMQGFKSFADRVELTFDRGVSAIVGPNGCGKSNVSDAVRWVLGEQRARSLRGAKMDEVIFQGSSSRRAVNIAEVSLHFDNDDGVLPVAFREVVITRRLSRSGESDYLLNRAPCRLRDIHDLLRGTGLGADSGVVIEARMVDALLSDRPDERRELFEEAAGIGLYRDRRRVTERRLDETAGDLTRLDDLISEVQSQVRSLGRQRKRSERHAELTGRKFTMEVTLAARDIETWSEELGALEKRVAELRLELPASDEAARAEEHKRDAAHVERSAAEGRRAELSRLVSAQQQDSLRLESEIRVAEERQRNSEFRRQRAEEERRVSEGYGSQVVAERAESERENIRLQRELEATSAELGTFAEAEEAARRAVVAARAEFDQIEKAVEEAWDSARRLDLDLGTAFREQEEIAPRLATLTKERAQHLKELHGAREQLEIATQKFEAARGAAFETNLRVATLREAGQVASAREGNCRAELLRVEESFTAIQAAVQALEGLERERVGLAPAAARLLRDRDRFGDGAVLGPLSDFITAGVASATLVERFLAGTVNAVLVRDRAVANEVRVWHGSTNPGPLLLLPLDAANSAAENPAEGSLAACVEVAEPAGPWVRALLGPAHAIEDGTAFVDARGAIWLPGLAAGPGPLRRRAELSSRRAELKTCVIAHEAARSAENDAKSSLEMAEQAVAKAVSDATAAAQSERHAGDERDDAERHVARMERDLANLEATLARLDQRQSELSIATRVGGEQKVAHEKSLAERQTELAQARAMLRESERGQEAAREECLKRQIEQAQARARLDVASDRARRLSDDAQTAQARVQGLVQELDEIQEADRKLAELLHEWRLDLERRQTAQRDSQARLARAEMSVRDTDALLAAADSALDDARKRTTAISDELHHSELRLAELSGRRMAIRERLEFEWRRPFAEMLATVSPSGVDVETLRAELATVRDELESLGPVNPLAIEEHEEELKRFQFLSTQRADLTSAKQSLHAAIREIDATAREMFLSTFAEVRGHFRQIFMTLFGGGECDLRLETPETPLDCDIEIHASPRGKRTQRIHLLSSGERALVALSLLFGIFLTKPSPFCLLDEVDAPLDDQNIGRFVRMLNEFKARTQFIVITHNPRTTTEAADTVYGVTMQEPGVSSFVSVRMRESPIEDAEAPIERMTEIEIGSELDLGAEADGVSKIAPSVETVAAPA
ncbi:MAG: chromosome segregation protein SMC [Gemmatimonadaceae bacterium]